jgi:hypothetical protein
MGYRESLKAHGIPYDENLVATGEFSQPPAFVLSRIGWQRVQKLTLFSVEMMKALLER